MRNPATSAAKRRAWRAMDEAQQRLVAAIPDPARPGQDDTWPGLVIEALRGMGFAAWIELDERSGWRDYGPWFALVRQVRNSPRHGPALLAAVHQRRRASK